MSHVAHLPVAHHWEPARVVLHVAPPAPSTGVKQPDLEATTRQAIETWASACPECSLPEVVLLPAPSSASAKQDGRNLILLRTGMWCPPTDEGAFDCYDAGRAAITHGYSLPGGERARFTEADIEINAVHYRWSVDSERPDAVSLQAVVLHEVGHFYGLVHDNHPSALMYAREVRPGGTLPTAPTKEDIGALRRLYPPLTDRLSDALLWLVIPLGLLIFGVLLLRHSGLRAASSKVQR